MITKNSTIILGAPSDFELDIQIKKNLEHLGFQVLLMKHVPVPLRISAKDVVIHNYLKIFKKDRTYKTEIRKKNQIATRIRKHKKLLSKIQKADYALLIRPDQYDTEILKKITEKSNLTAAYQWDGLERFNFPRSIIPLFDRFFVFDSNDLKEDPTYLPTTNFYFDYIKNDYPIEKDIFFVGSYLPERTEIISKMAEILYNAGLKTDINILSFDEEVVSKYQSASLNIIQKPYSFEENLKNILSSRIILDFSNSVHHGLSFRAYESVGYRKKLITNNDLVKKYDFYHPDNIFVVENDNIEELLSFINKPYKTLDPELYEKYSFTNWIKYILNIKPHIPLNLP